MRNEARIAECDRRIAEAHADMDEARRAYYAGEITDIHKNDIIAFANKRIKTAFKDRYIFGG